MSNNRVQLPEPFGSKLEALVANKVTQRIDHAVAMHSVPSATALQKIMDEEIAFASAVAKLVGEYLGDAIKEVKP